MLENFIFLFIDELFKKVIIVKKFEFIFGWNIYLERINGRFVMVGFVILLLLEIFIY